MRLNYFIGLLHKFNFLREELNKSDLKTIKQPNMQKYNLQSY